MVILFHMAVWTHTEWKHQARWGREVNAHSAKSGKLLGSKKHHIVQYCIHRIMVQRGIQSRGIADMSQHPAAHAIRWGYMWFMIKTEHKFCFNMFPSTFFDIIGRLFFLAFWYPAFDRFNGTRVLWSCLAQKWRGKRQASPHKATHKFLQHSEKQRSNVLPSTQRYVFKWDCFEGLFSVSGHIYSNIICIGSTPCVRVLIPCLLWHFLHVCAGLDRMWFASSLSPIPHLNCLPIFQLQSQKKT